MKRGITLDESLEQVLLAADGKPMEVRKVFSILKHRGIPVILIVLCIPFCLPIQIPGVSTPFGLAIALMGLRMAFGQRLWWPKWILDRKLSHASIKKLVTKLHEWVNFTKKILKPRLLFFSQSAYVHRINGLIIAVLGILLALPLPIPFTNLFSAFPLLFMGLGLLEDDGAAILISWIMSGLSLLFWISLFVLSNQLLAAA